MDEGEEDYELDFNFKKTVWNKEMVLQFKENEDIGKVDPIFIKMPSFVFKGLDDNMLHLVLHIICYGTLGVVAFMFWKRNPLVWSVMDTIITFCFMIYLNFELPFNVQEFFYFFNIKRIDQLHFGLGEALIGTIEG